MVHAHRCARRQMAPAVGYQSHRAAQELVVPAAQNPPCLWTRAASQSGATEASRRCRQRKARCTPRVANS
eukprot:3263290-Prymnesium_polylepis.2